MQATTEARLALAADGAFSPEAAAHFLGLGRTEVYRLMKIGELASAKIGRRRVVFKRSAVELLARKAAG